jgi:hypothetical protein
MAQQLHQLDQPARMLVQPREREGVTQAAGADVGSGQSGPSDQGGDDILHRAYRHGRATTRLERCGLGLRRRFLFEELSQGAAGAGVQRHLTLLEALADSCSDSVGAFAEDDVATAQRCHLANAQAGLNHELADGIIAPGKTMGTFAGGTQQVVHLGSRQTERSALANDAN